LTDRLSASLVAAGLPKPNVFVSPKQALGIRSAYDKPETLGRDRFLGMVGARSMYDGPFLLADAGTAMTVDVVDSDGQHLGGLIVPGPVLMREALHQGTAGVRAVAVQRLHALARNTDDAVWSGACLACVALIEHSHRDATLGIGDHVELILTGGAMSALVGHIEAPHQFVADVVFRGLDRWSLSGESN
jgi:type III pantothenate kinase